MTYRDDRDADRARIEALEAELTRARGRIAELEGRESRALVVAETGALAPASGTSARWWGAPLRLELTRQFDGAVPADEFENLIGRIRSMSRDHGSAELLKASMTWTATAGQQSAGPFTVITVMVRDGKTTLTATDRLGPLAGAYYGGVGGGVGAGGIILPILATTAVPVLAPVFLVSWFGAAFWASRALFRRTARRRAGELQKLFDALVIDVEQVLSKRPLTTDAVG
ncbi:MAG: hypothetical protein AB7P03_11135 [Kofleriaceae bacterium]